MKALKYKSLITAAFFMIAGGLISESAYAQRGGSRGSGGGSRGGSVGGSRAGSVSRGSAGVSRSSGSVNRSSATLSRGNSFGANRSSGTVNRGNPGNISASQQRFSGRAGYGRPGYGDRGGYRGRTGYGRPGYGRRGYGWPRYGGVHYGFYGRPNYGYYNYYRPYLGFSFSVLPFGYYPFMFGTDQFYYSGGLFYRQYDNQYKVVDPPVGGEILKLPDDAREVVINGQTFYEYKGVYYTVSENADGKTVYIVAGKDGVLNTDGDIDNAPKMGDIVNELPEGSNEVLLKGERYFVSPDHIYYEEVKDGDATTYRVVGL